MRARTTGSVFPATGHGVVMARRCLRAGGGCAFHVKRAIYSSIGDDHERGGNSVAPPPRLIPESSTVRCGGGQPHSPYVGPVGEASDLPAGRRLIDAVGLFLGCAETTYVCGADWCYMHRDVGSDAGVSNAGKGGDWCAEAQATLIGRWTDRTFHVKHARRCGSLGPTFPSGQRRLMISRLGCTDVAEVTD